MSSSNYSNHTMRYFIQSFLPRTAPKSPRPVSFVSNLYSLLRDTHSRSRCVVDQVQSKFMAPLHLHHTFTNSHMFRRGLEKQKSCRHIINSCLPPRPRSTVSLTECGCETLQRGLPPSPFNSQRFGNVTPRATVSSSPDRYSMLMSESGSATGMTLKSDWNQSNGIIHPYEAVTCLIPR